MAGIVTGRLGWNVTRDDDGFRNYRVIHKVLTTSTEDGPQAALNAAGLPLIGSAWNLGNDFDPWSFCLPNATVTIHKEKFGDPTKHWKVLQLFSNKPRSERCQDQEIDDPLLEPQRVSGTFTQDTFQAGKGYSSTALAKAGGERGKLLATSGHEPLRGLNVRDGNPTVRVEQNVAVLGLDTFSQMVNTLNDASLWGLQRRRILLANVTWERRVQGTCDFYYTRTFDFEVKFDDWDWKVPDYGTMVLKGQWVTTEAGPGWVPDAGVDEDNIGDFTRYKDVHGENARTFLDGLGKPAANEEAGAEIDIIYYKESDFLTLGIPTIL